MKNRKRNRMLEFDYSSDNLYFVTICVQDRICYFGNVGTGRDLSVPIDNPNNPNQKMRLNEFGKIAHGQWEWLGNQYSYIVLHSFIVMPNHVHGIIEINSNLGKDNFIKIKSLSELIGAYKTTSSKQIHLLGNDKFAWQRSFYDHIIRDEAAYERICNYIDTNAEKWIDDTFYE
ncbi:MULTISPECIES: transposase [unclassified Flavobacterium]|jgi:REP element-mobilizing transposase RayT|uniref:transposase n=1 Tax=unclassified Flavobacterium TaxID=196869 RepID=UPI0025BC679D|nr:MULTISPECIES: transposase [unclassified Flavobacterium]